MTEIPSSIISNVHLDSLVEIATNCPPGCFVEFGVYQGGSAWHLARLAERQGREIHLYDTFTGIPFKDEVDTHRIGDFGDVSLEKVKALIPYAIFHQGIFPDSLVSMPPIAFAHIDADQYRSIKAACEVFGPLMVEGGVMVFDDVGCLEGATKALLETGLEITKTNVGKAMVRF